LSSVDREAAVAEGGRGRALAPICMAELNGDRVERIRVKTSKNGVKKNPGQMNTYKHVQQAGSKQNKRKKMET